MRRSMTTESMRLAAEEAMNHVQHLSERKRASIAKLVNKDIDLVSYRYKIAVMLVSPFCEVGLLLVISLNFVLLIIETDGTSDPYPYAEDSTRAAPAMVVSLNYVLSAIYALELVVRIYVMRTGIVFDPASLLDAFIVMTDLIMLCLDMVFSGMPRVAILRCFRLIRVTRVFKALSMFKELNYLLLGFACAFKAIFWGLIMIIVTLIMWAILAVQIIHPVNRRVAFETTHYDGCTRCPHAFESIWASFNTFWQTLVAGDSWGQVALPIIEVEPLAWVFFAMVLVTVSLAIMNLILAVIVEAGQDARETAIRAQQEKEKEEHMVLMAKLRKLCEDMDQDDNGELSVEELENGHAENPEFRDIMNALDVPMHDIGLMVKAIDQDGSGTIAEQEFFKELDIICTSELRKLVCSLRFAVGDIKHNVNQILDFAKQGKLSKASGEEEHPNRDPKFFAAEEKATGMIKDVDALRVERLTGAVQAMLQQSDEQLRVLSSLVVAVGALVKSCVGDAKPNWIASVNGRQQVQSCVEGMKVPQLPVTERVIHAHREPHRPLSI